MNNKIIDIIAGARPNFMKIAPIIKAMYKANFKDKGIQYRLIHTGQHYDKNMSEDFFIQLGIPTPHHNLHAGSGTQAEQTAKIMLGYEKILLEKPSNLCLVVGDVTSTMACSITAKKLNIQVAHVEAGIRSFDMTMPEEVNRMVTDSITDYFFTTSEIANQNLRNNGIGHNQIFFVGNTMIDTLLNSINEFRKPSIWEEEQLKSKEYIVMTLHRPANVDDSDNLIKIIEVICKVVGKNKIIFPVHPRTAKIFEKILFSRTNLILTAPMNYLEFNYLVKNAKVVITDSGGITEETTVMGVPCLTFRDTTERPETCIIGTNELIGTNPENLISPLNQIYTNKWKKGSIPPKWDGKAGERIIEIIENIILN